jgi:hypothetical protein
LELQGGKILALHLVSDVAASDSDLFKITYDVESLTDRHGEPGASGTAPIIRPRIEYFALNNDPHPSPITDLLQVNEIARASDLSKIKLLGSAVLSKMNILTDPEVIASRGKLESLRMVEMDVIVITRTGDSPQQAIAVNFAHLFEFLQRVASSLRSVLDKLKEKTPLKDEVIMRQELEGGQRKEFTVNLDDLRSQLINNVQYGKPISDALGL